jgi:hypothetical protein
MDNSSQIFVYRNKETFAKLYFTIPILLVLHAK